MKFPVLAVSLVILSSALDSSNAFSTRKNVRSFQSLALRSTTAEAPVTESLTNDIISKLQFREAQEKLESLKLDTSGTLSEMRDRLRSLAGHKSVHSTSAAGKVNGVDEDKLNKVRPVF